LPFTTTVFASLNLNRVTLLNYNVPFRTSRNNLKSANMPRGNTAQYKVFHKGTEEDFIIFVDSPKDLAAWKEDRSIPLAQVVSGFKIMISHKYAGLDSHLMSWRDH
jgi:hypothetical protein